MVLQSIGGALEALAQEPTTVSDGTERTDAALAETHQYYQDFRESVDLGCLRQTTVFPGQSVSGFLYFPMPGKPTRARSADPGESLRRPLDAKECRFHLSVSAPVQITDQAFSLAVGQ